MKPVGFVALSAASIMASSDLEVEEIGGKAYFLVGGMCPMTSCF